MIELRLAAAAAMALVLASAAPAQPATYVVDVRSFAFAPQPIRLAVGKPVTMVFANRSGSGHDFTAAKFFRNATIVSGAAPNGEVELAPHQTRSITLIPRAGTYKAHCSHFLHKQMGMQDVIIVN
jgi:plastocyanin